MSAVSSKAMQVILAPRLNEHLMSFMEIDDLERLKLASKKIPQAPIEKIFRERVLTALGPENGMVKHYGKEALNGVAIRNFPTQIRAPLSRYPGVSMAGFEQIAPGKFTLYVLERNEIIAKPCCLPCLPHWTQARVCFVKGEATEDSEPQELESPQQAVRDENGRIFQREPVCCEYVEPFAPHTGLKAIRTLCCKIFLCCCFQEPLLTYGFASTVEANTSRKT